MFAAGSKGSRVEDAPRGGIVGAFLSMKNGLTDSALYKKAKSFG